ncbi:uncharacterized metal-binding protein YceD (DUF177 family) [Lutibacter sp. Hel_I_33_5]|uniref:YceD family protein n=1 Tax=Lutibacter sp. Hel_I_33_5 TaxID=1566289 RepID=UPI0011A0E954|nr:DUF177 domain-containing protein [Lutibacter sp. Hel_I_33_5]TVZ56634.1 uncharacterized metal-binding protein YceD (DUF177 family) [Lutibacter sp. Hel_I_33_5]
MKDLKKFNIQFVGLKEGSHLFEYQIDNTFFEAFNFDEYLDSNLNVQINFVKKPTLLELSFTVNGTINVPCDITNEPFDLIIDGKLPLLIKFGEEYNDDNEELIIVAHGSYEINVAQYIYEMIVLAVPTKRVHPKVIDGTLESEALKRLKQLEIKESKTVEKTDPRWDKLKDLLTEKNK